MSREECYRILGVSPDADSQEIKRAYRKQAKLFHPDVNSGDGAQEEFVKVNEAYEMLVNEGASYQSSQLASAFENVYFYTFETRQERAERAANFARMYYEEFRRNNEEFKKSFYYVPVKIFAYTLWTFAALMGFVMLFMPLVMLGYDLPLGFSMMPVMMVGITILYGVRRFKLEMNRYL